MAESYHRSHRDPAAARSAPTPPRDQSDDPLAGLARLIVQSPPLAHDARRPPAEGSRAPREFNLPARHGYAASDDFFDSPSGTHDERHYESWPRADVSPQSRSTWCEHEPDAADPDVEASGLRYDDYEDQSHAHSDDHADGEDCDEDPIPRRRGEFVFVAAAFGLALLGTAGASVYRAPFTDSIVPSLLSIIKAEGGPNKTIQTSQADADKAGSGERLVPSEDRPADVPPPVSTPSQPVSSAPISADPTPALEPGPLAQPAPATRVETLNNPPAVAVPPIARADQAAAPEAPTPNAADSAASQPQSDPRRLTHRLRGRSAERKGRISPAKPSDANGPLSIVPSSNDAAKAAVASARTALPERSARVGKPATTKIASTAPAASGRGYAVQVSSQRNQMEVQSSFRTLQAKYPKLLGGREPMVRRADLGTKGIYYRAMVGRLVSAEQANELCSNLKAAGGNCIVQKY